MSIDQNALDPRMDGADHVDVSAARGSTLRSLLRNPVAVACLTFLLILLIIGIASPWLAPYSPSKTDLNAINAKPFSDGHLFGADTTGRDILSRLMHGTRLSIVACVLVLGVSLLVGLPSGLVAGYYRGRVDAVVSFASDVMMSLPGIVLLIALYSLTGPNIPVAMAVFGLIVAPSFFRLVRGVVVGVRSELYIDAAKVVGLPDRRIVGKHVLWAVRAPVIVQSSFVLATAIGILAGVDFLGLGDPAQPSWGRVLQDATNNIYTNPGTVLWPALLITLTILAFVLLGNALRDVLQASSRRRALKPARRQEFVRRARAARLASPPHTAAPQDAALLSIRDLRIGYPVDQQEVREVVHGVDLDVRRGEVHGLVGESGSGKSQIAFSTLGILPRDAVILGGSIWMDGEDLLADDNAMQRARGRRIAYIPQEPMSNLDPSFTIGAQLSYGLRAATDLSKTAARLKLVELLGRVGITDPSRVMRLYPHQISGGMAQRVLICGAVAADPDLIVADEPTTALDVTVQAEVLEVLRQLSRERGLAMILVTHNLGVVADLCDTVSVMKDGQIVERNDVDSLFSAPREAYTRDLLASSREVELMEV